MARVVVLDVDGTDGAFARAELEEAGAADVYEYCAFLLDSDPPE